MFFCNSLAFSMIQGLPGGLDSKEESTHNVGDLGSIPALGRSHGGGHGNPLKYSCLKNPMDRGAWRATVHRVAESDTTERLSTQQAGGSHGCSPSSPFYRPSLVHDLATKQQVERKDKCFQSVCVCLVTKSCLILLRPHRL